MPKLYEYLGLLVMFYANEHEPVHVHGKAQGREARAAIILVDGQVTEVRFSDVAGRQPLKPTDRRNFETLERARAKEIVTKWIDFFVLHKSVQPERIIGRLK